MSQANNMITQSQTEWCIGGELLTTYSLVHMRKETFSWNFILGTKYLRYKLAKLGIFLKTVQLCPKYQISWIIIIYRKIKMLYTSDKLWNLSQS